MKALQILGSGVLNALHAIPLATEPDDYIAIVLTNSRKRMTNMEFYTKVAGVTFSNTGMNTENRQRIIARLSRDGILKHGTELTLRRDSANPYDANAVAVLAPDGRQLGFLPREVAAMTSPDMARGARYKAYVEAVTGGDANTLYGINLKIVKEEAHTTPASKTTPFIYSDRRRNKSKSDFVIENGALIRYTGSGGDVVVPEGLKSIGQNAFDGCMGLTSITLPKGLKSIGNSAFNGCGGLKNITLPEGLQRIGNDAFIWCRELRRITLPEGLLSIGWNVFHWCSELTSITLPEGLKSIGNGTFAGCTGLKSIRFPKSLQSIGNYAFAGCVELTNITLPEELKSIGWKAFAGCVGLKRIKLPKSLQSISDDAFYRCENLTIYASGISHAAEYAREHGIPIIIEPMVSQAITPKESSAGVLQGIAAPKLLSIKNDLVIENGALIRYTGSAEDVVVPEGVQRVGDGAFDGCRGLTSITLPEGLQSIGNRAFCECGGLTSIALPEGLQSIGDSAFYGCMRLTSITLPKSLRSIRNSAFDWCKNLTIYTSAGTYAAKYAREHGIPLITEPREFQVAVSKGNSTSISKGIATPNILKNKSDFVIENGTLIQYTSSGGDVVVPEGVQSIGDGAFDGCRGLTSITFSEGLQSIGDRAFCECGKLTSIALPEGLQSIGDSAFYGCTELTSITLPMSLQSTSDSAFDWCKNLTIYASAGSYAAKYARGHGIPLITEPRNIQAVTPKESSVGISKGNANPNLLVCPDCGGTVSRRASACPHCGCPIAIILEEQEN